jgi:hypothetical protein
MGAKTLWIVYAVGLIHQWNYKNQQIMIREIITKSFKNPWMHVIFQQLCHSFKYKVLIKSLPNINVKAALSNRVHTVSKYIHRYLAYINDCYAHLLEMWI